jgi:hypothetical protein
LVFQHLPFFGHVFDVVHVGSQKQMLGITTRPIVTAMKHKHTSLNHSVGQFPSNSVGQKQPFMAKYSVPVVSDTTDPIPAIIGSAFFNLFPKSSFKRFLIPLKYFLTHEFVGFWRSFWIHRVYNDILDTKESNVILC